MNDFMNLKCAQTAYHRMEFPLVVVVAVDASIVVVVVHFPFDVGKICTNRNCIHRHKGNISYYSTSNEHTIEHTDTHSSTSFRMLCVIRLCLHDFLFVLHLHKQYAFRNGEEF